MTVSTRESTMGGRTGPPQPAAGGDEAGTAPGDRAFRPDIQGLRAVAVLVVVLFHAHVPGVGGGYVGVDVFFVISGFVITGLLLREREATGVTSLLAFYGRRIRRILPAATLVIVVAVIAAYVVLGPLDGNQTAGDARWASVFLINVHFATNGTNYLASLLPPSLLQNFWSLAVEEQFYIVYPTMFLVVAAIAARRRHRDHRALLGAVLALACIGSFTVSVVQTSHDPTAAFFSPVPRIWELALGGIVALSTTTLRRLPVPVAVALGWSGLAAIAVAACTYSSTTSFPGWAVAVPVLGSAAVIAGGASAPRYGAELLLGVRPFLWVGAISYSLYLWHWPLLTLAAEHRGTTALPVGDGLWWVLVSLGLAVVTYRLVENPVRHSRFLLVRRWTTLGVGVCLVACSLVVATIGLDGHDAGAPAVAALGQLQTDAFCPEGSLQKLTPGMASSARVRRNPTARIMVVGDSTACTMIPGLQAVAAPAGVQVEDAAVVGCGVASGWVVMDTGSADPIENASRRCAARSAAAVSSALRGGVPQVVVWSSVWENSPLVVGTLAHPKVLKPGTAAWHSVVSERIRRRVSQLTADGARVVLLSQVPFARSNASLVKEDVHQFTALNAVLRSVAQDMPDVSYLDVSPRECPAGPPCPLVVDNVWVRGDGVHFTAGGSLWFARWLAPRLGVPALARPGTLVPVMTALLPVPGSVVHGTTTVDAKAAFDTRITRVDFELSGGDVHDRRICTTTTHNNYGWACHDWDSRSVPDGTYSLRAVAVLSDGRTSTSKPDTFTVVNGAS